MIIDGERIKELVSHASRRVVICAPFIKIGAFRVIMNVIPKGVQLEVITRWRPEEIAAGISDLAVYDLAIERENTKILLLDELHAKLYIADDQCLVGSANITGAALGWSARPNIEILVSIPVSDRQISQLLSRFAYAKPATMDIRDEIATLAAKLQTVPLLPDEITDIDIPLSKTTWLPRYAAPEKLYSIYEKVISNDINTSLSEDGIADIKDMGLPDGLEKEDFYKYISITLEEFPAISFVLSKIPSKLTDSNGINLIHELKPHLDREDAKRQWHILREWIREFYANQFEVAPESFVLRIKS